MPRPEHSNPVAMKIAVPDFCLVMLLGVPSATAAFAERHFARTETVEPNASGDALLMEVERRLAARALTVVDVTRLPEADRTALLRTAKRRFTHAIAIVVESDADDPANTRDLHRITKRLKHEGVRTIHEVSAKQTSTVEVVRERLPTDWRDVMGPFDIIGDVHGCTDELELLLARLGYGVAWREEAGERRVAVTPPAGRRLIFVGDLVDRGPRTPDTLRIVMSAVASGAGFCVPGNHDAKFVRWLEGRNVQLNHGLDASAAQMSTEPKSFHEAARSFLAALPSHMWCDGGALVVAHAGIREDMIGRAAPAVREFCLYGDTDGTMDAAGMPVRYHWAANYRGSPAIIYGHTPMPEVAWVNNTLCIDTGSCFGGSLTAVRWPERKIVSVPALRQYASARRLFGHPPLRPRRQEGAIES